MRIRLPCKTAIYVLIFRLINPMRNRDCCCIKNKSIFHFFHILANKICRIFVLRVAWNGTMPVLPACSAILQRIRILMTLKKRQGLALTSALCFFIATCQKQAGSVPIGMVEYWNIGKMGLDLRLGEDTAILDK